MTRHCAHCGQNPRATGMARHLAALCTACIATVPSTSDPATCTHQHATTGQLAARLVDGRCVLCMDPVAPFVPGAALAAYLARVGHTCATCAPHQV